MLILETALQLFIIIYVLLALLGAYIVAYITFKSGKKMDNTVLRARAFLSESFLKDNWMLLSLTCLFFSIHALMELNGMLGLFIEESLSELIRATTGLGIITCVVISSFKWFKLINPAEHLRQSVEQESHLIKK